jgi:hypothetical protein
MRIVTAMIVGSGLVWLAAVAWWGWPVSMAALWGVSGPLGVAAGSWVVAARVYRVSPSQLTAVMMAAFAAKMVFFGAYVVIALKGFSVTPVPFAVSFTAAFIGLYMIEALALRRLFAAGQDHAR